MLRDRLVVGIRDQELSKELQMDADLTLEAAKKKIRQKEAVHEQTQELEGDAKKDALQLEELKHGRGGAKHLRY